MRPDLPPEDIQRCDQAAHRLWLRIRLRVHGDLGEEDLRQEAYLALWLALQRFEVERGVSLWGYAQKRVLGAMVARIKESCRPQEISLEDCPREVLAKEVDLDLALDARKRRAEQEEEDAPTRQVVSILGYGDSKKPLSVAEVAKARGISEVAVRKQLRRGALLGSRKRRGWEIPAWAAVG